MSDESDDESVVPSEHEQETNDKVTQNIQVFCRIKPSNQSIKQSKASNQAIKPAVNSCVSLDDYENTITFTVPPTLDTTGSQLINHSKSSYTYSFHGLFDQTINQSTIFERLGKPCVNTVLEGYNSTVFAYGQTGSGKTFTVTGGTDSYESRGLIPRTLSYLFDTINKSNNQSIDESTDNPSGNTTYTVKISYLEIYNDSGYDLLDRDDVFDLASLKKVTLCEDDKQNLHLLGLSEYTVTSVNEALELLFRGDTNRIVCETPSNDASTRSHCIFTINLESVNQVTNRSRRSKLNLVDLAGSERIKKTNVVGKLAKEASFINLSLHHLEQVIVALHERSVNQAKDPSNQSSKRHVHVPYRNSMMTNVLRDSLGGNCRTVMIATFNESIESIEESISTARFAARVGSIVNQCFIQESEDLPTLVKKLKYQVKDLKNEVVKLRGGFIDQPLDQTIKETINEAIKQFLIDGDLKGLPLQSDNRVRYYLTHMRQLINQSSYQSDDQLVNHTHKQSFDQSADVKRLTDQVQELQSEVAERDQTINQLISQLEEIDQNQSVKHSNHHQSSIPNNQSSNGRSSPQQQRPNNQSQNQSNNQSNNQPNSQSNNQSNSQSVDQALFEQFKASYSQNQSIELKTDDLRALIDQAKQLGESINQSRQTINQSKALLQAKRVQREVSQSVSQSNDHSDDQLMDQAERMIIQSIETEKQKYRTNFDQLKLIKQSIDHLKGLIERSRRIMQADFERWQEQQSGGSSSNNQQIQMHQSSYSSNSQSHNRPANLTNNYSQPNSRPASSHSNQSFNQSNNQSNTSSFSQSNNQTNATPRSSREHRSRSSNQSLCGDLEQKEHIHLQSMTRPPVTAAMISNQPTNQTTNQSNKHPPPFLAPMSNQHNQSINPSYHQDNQPSHHAIRSPSSMSMHSNHSNQSILHSINHPNNQPLKQSLSITQPINQSNSSYHPNHQASTQPIGQTRPSHNQPLHQSNNQSMNRLLSTGNPHADADIASFYALRDQLMQQTVNRR